MLRPGLAIKKDIIYVASGVGRSLFETHKNAVATTNVGLEILSGIMIRSSWSKTMCLFPIPPNNSVLAIHA